VADEIEALLQWPAPGEVFRAESAERWRERVRAEAERRGRRAVFPGEAQSATAPFKCLERPFPPEVARLVPSGVCHWPLYFDDPETERYGRYVPGVQPLLSTSLFYLNTLLLPYSLVTEPPWTCQCEPAD
jgi:hypothetical protein